jgi:ribosome-associated protein
MLEIDPSLSIPEDELSFSASRAGGPGGQHVNKVSSRVTLRFDVGGSPSLDASRRRRLLSRLATRINRDGVLVMHCQKHRSQAANRAELRERFRELLRVALARRKKRVSTRPSRAAVRRRLEGKRRRGRLKRERGGDHDE